MEAITTCLRKVGGSVMLTVPPAYLDFLHLQPGSMGGISVDNGRLMVDPMPRPKYTLAELLAVSDYSQPQTSERNARRVEAMPAAVMNEVLAKLLPIFK